MGRAFVTNHDVDEVNCIISLLSDTFVRVYEIWKKTELKKTEFEKKMESIEVKKEYASHIADYLVLLDGTENISEAFSESIKASLSTNDIELEFITGLKESAEKVVNTLDNIKLFKEFE